MVARAARAATGRDREGRCAVKRIDAALTIGALLGLLGVGAGAMGAHALRGRIDDKALGWWETAAHYAQVHAPPRPGLVRTSIVSLAVGIVIFAGTLDAMALGGPRWLGAITPLGGTCLLVGWLAIALHGLRKKP
jgi:uncharacterized membrane protein YgdD (TMEM256/DUF423 family)